MIQELVYTSVPKGLKLGSSGFCTVASSHGMSVNLAGFLESLSGYRHLNEPGSSNNPVNYSHVKNKIGGREYSILSRVADAGLDYSNRSNKIAHHVAVLPEDRGLSSPIEILAGPSMISSWNEQPRTLDPHPLGNAQKISCGICSTWQRYFGDAGWGGVVIDQAKSGKNVFVVIDPSIPILDLMKESLALLSSHEQWDITFSTFFTRLPPKVDCKIRFVAAGSEEAASARINRNALTIDATSKGSPPPSKYVEAARCGTRPAASAPPQPKAGVASAPHANPRKHPEEDLPFVEDEYRAEPIPIPKGGVPQMPNPKGQKSESSAPRPVAPVPLPSSEERPSTSKAGIWITLAICLSVMILISIGMFFGFDYYYGQKLTQSSEWFDQEVSKLNGQIGELEAANLNLEEKIKQPNPNQFKEDGYDKILRETEIRSIEKIVRRVKSYDQLENDLIVAKKDVRIAKEELAVKDEGHSYYVALKKTLGKLPTQDEIKKWKEKSQSKINASNVMSTFRVFKPASGKKQIIGISAPDDQLDWIMLPKRKNDSVTKIAGKIDFAKNAEGKWKGKKTIENLNVTIDIERDENGLLLMSHFIDGPGSDDYSLDLQYFIAKPLNSKQAQVSWQPVLDKQIVTINTLAEVGLGSVKDRLSDMAIVPYVIDIQTNKKYTNDLIDGKGPLVQIEGSKIKKFTSTTLNNYISHLVGQIKNAEENKKKTNQKINKESDNNRKMNLVKESEKLLQQIKSLETQKTQIEAFKTKLNAQHLGIGLFLQFEGATTESEIPIAILKLKAAKIGSNASNKNPKNGKLSSDIGNITID